MMRISSARWSSTAWRSIASPRWLIGLMSVLLIGGCSSGLTVQPATVGDPGATQRENSPSRLAGDGGLNLLSLGGRSNSNSSGGGGIGVNSFLWRASLDTVAFMPLASADPFGGVIISDWYSPPESPEERFKVNVFILGRDLRADGVRASVFHQKKDAAGQWSEAPVDANTATDLENAILTRARQS